VGFNFRFAPVFRHLSNSFNGDHHSRSLLLEFRSRHPSGPEWGVNDAREAWLRHNGVHAVDLALWLLGSPRSIDASSFNAQDGRSLIHLSIVHTGGNHSLLRLGNLTERFSLSSTTITSQAIEYTSRNLSLLTIRSHDRDHKEETIYEAPDLEPPWHKSGHSEALNAFVASGGNADTTLPTLADALSASDLIDRAMQQLHSDSHGLQHAVASPANCSFPGGDAEARA